MRQVARDRRRALASGAWLLAGCLAGSAALLLEFGPRLVRRTMPPHANRDALPFVKPGLAPLEASEAIRRLEELDPRSPEGLADATMLMAAAFVHYWPPPGVVDREVEVRFLEHPWLWLRIAAARARGAAEADIARLARRERADWRTATRLGVGYCSQQALALAAYLRERGIEAEAIDLFGHVVTRARLDGGEWLLDPDYAAVLPFGPEAAAAAPEEVEARYGRIGWPADRAKVVADIYAAGRCGSYTVAIGPRRHAAFVVFPAAIAVGCLFLGFRLRRRPAPLPDGGIR